MYHLHELLNPPISKLFLLPQIVFSHFRHEMFFWSGKETERSALNFANIAEKDLLKANRRNPRSLNLLFDESSDHNDI